MSSQTTTEGTWVHVDTVTPPEGTCMLIYADEGIAMAYHENGDWFNSHDCTPFLFANSTNIYWQHLPKQPCF